MLAELPEDKIKDAVQGLQAIAHEVRLSALCCLLERPMCVHELMEATGAKQSNLSQHLSKMRLMGLLTNTKHGQEVYYEVANPSYVNLIYALKQIYCPELCA